MTAGHRVAATDAAPEDRSCLDLKHLYLEELRRILASEKPRAWPRGIQWIIDYTETHPVGVHRGARDRTGVRTDLPTGVYARSLDLGFTTGLCRAQGLGG